MKKIFFFAISLMLLSNYSSKAQKSLVQDSLDMLASYANEVYYSMATGQVTSVPRNTWDIAFRTAKVSSSIIINDGRNVELYTYPHADTSGWATIDTTGMAGWTKMYNDPTDWENGAFSVNALGHPDYGWCIYNSTTHNLIADSLYVIKTRNGSVKKIWIERKLSSLATYVFRYANIDGSELQSVTLDCTPYLTKDFLGYDLQTNAMVDFQPAKDSWDLVFTKYMSVQHDGSRYPTTACLSNSKTEVARYAGVPLSYTNWGPGPFLTDRSAIGWDWKYFDMGSFTYFVEDSLVFFVKPLSGDMYKLVFSRFDGSATGRVVFGKAKVSSTGIESENENQAMVHVYPNPVSQTAHINFLAQSTGLAQVSIADLTGKIVSTASFHYSKNETAQIGMDVSGLTAGIYLLKVASPTGTSVQKLMINR